MRDNYTHIVIVLDRSGSMSAILGDTIGGYNSFLKSQRKAPGYATITLRTFETKLHEPTYDFAPIREAPDLSTESYVPGGMTALFDAVALTIRDTGERLRVMPEHTRPSRVLFVIVTDGQENASREYREYSLVADLIKHQTDIYKWQFVFLAAHQDAMKTADKMNISRGSTMTVAANALGTASAYHSLGVHTRSYRGGTAQSVRFDDYDRLAQTESGVAPELNDVNSPKTDGA